MGTTNSNKSSQSFLSDYNIIQQNISQHIKFLQHKVTYQEYLLKQYTFSNMKDCNFMMQKLSNIKYKLDVDSKKNIVQIKDYLMKNQPVYCGAWWKIYVLWDYPHRTIDDQINQRKINKKFFSQSEMWSLLGSSIIALSHLQANNITHQSLKTSNILLNQQGILKICHPIALSLPTNYQQLLIRQSYKHIYSSPQHCRSLQDQLIAPNGNPYKSDVFTLGIIMFQIALLEYQDVTCYKDRGWSISWEDVQYSLRRVREKYSKNLEHIIRYMLTQNQNSRPDWLYLQNYVPKIQSSQHRSTFINNLTNSNSIQTQSIRSSIYSLKQNLRQPSYHSIHSENNNHYNFTFQNHHSGFKINNQAYSSAQKQFAKPKAFTTNRNNIQRLPQGTKIQRISSPVYLNSQMLPTTFTTPGRPSSNSGLETDYQSKLSFNPMLSSYQPHSPYQISYAAQPNTAMRLNPSVPTHMLTQNFYPLKPSIIDRTRPYRNIFPSDSYLIKTKNDIIQLQNHQQQKLSQIQNTQKTKKDNKYSINVDKLTPVAMSKSVIQTKIISKTIYPSNSHQNLPYTIQSNKYLPLNTPSKNNLETINQPTSSYNNLGQNLNMFPSYNSLKNLHSTQNKQLQINNRSNQNINTPSDLQQIKISQPLQNPLGIQYVCQKYPLGSRYQGQKLNNFRHGYGKFYYQDGGFYQGQWKYNKMDGLGKLYYQSNKLAYEGQWKNDQFYGYGTIYNQQYDMLKGGFNYKDFDQLDDYWVKYQGQFIKDSKNGKGTLYLTNGQKFEGSFKDDYAQGKGTFYCKNGKKVTGIWKQNQKIS